MNDGEDGVSALAPVPRAGRLSSSVNVAWPAAARLPRDGSFHGPEGNGQVGVKEQYIS
jgi:hypothetical protein